MENLRNPLNQTKSRSYCEVFMLNSIAPLHVADSKIIVEVASKIGKRRQVL